MSTVSILFYRGSIWLDVLHQQFSKVTLWVLA